MYLQWKLVWYNSIYCTVSTLNKLYSSKFKDHNVLLCLLVRNSDSLACRYKYFAQLSILWLIRLILFVDFVGFEFPSAEIFDFEQPFFTDHRRLFGHFWSYRRVNFVYVFWQAKMLNEYNLLLSCNVLSETSRVYLHARKCKPSLLDGLWLLLCVFTETEYSQVYL